MDEVQLSLDLVAAWVVHSRGVFIEHQVLSARPKSVKRTKMLNSFSLTLELGMCAHLS